MLGCRTVQSLLDHAYREIRQGLGFDRLGIQLVEPSGEALVEYIGTDEQGRKFHPSGRVSALPGDDYHARLVADPRMQPEGPGFILLDDACSGVPPAALARFDGCPRQILRVALRAPDRLVGLISVDNLISGRPIVAVDVPPLLAFANTLAAALQNARVLEERARQISTLDTDLRQRVATMEWLREISRQVNAAGPLHDVLDVVYDGIRSGLEYDRVGIDLIDHQAGNFTEYMGTNAAGMKTRPNDRVVSLDRESDIWSLPGIAALLRGAEYYYTSDAYAEWPENRRYILDGTSRQMLQVPLRSGSTITGIISVDNLLSGRPIGEADAAPLLALANQVGTAVENARLYARERARALAAEELAQVRSDFVAAVSHELRTPLTAILGYAELLEGRWEQFDDAQRLAGMRKIVLSANRQRRLVEELLLLTRIESRDVLVQIHPVPVDELVRRAIEDVVATYRGQGVSASGPEHLPVATDADRAVQVLVNLLDNAAKYSPEGCQISVIWQLEDETVAIRVRDFGTGIPASGREALFTRFGRLPGSRARSGRVGTGLGLYLSRQLATAMGGSLDLEHTSREGSTFALRLPLASVPASREGGAGPAAAAACAKG